MHAHTDITSGINTTYFSKQLTALWERNYFISVHSSNWLSHFVCIAEQKILPALWLEFCSTPFCMVWCFLFVFKSWTNFSLKFYFPSVPLYSKDTAFVFMEKVFSSLFYKVKNKENYYYPLICQNSVSYS